MLILSIIMLILTISVFRCWAHYLRDYSNVALKISILILCYTIYIMNINFSYQLDVFNSLLKITNLYSIFIAFIYILTIIIFVYHSYDKIQKVRIDGIVQNNNYRNTNPTAHKNSKEYSLIILFTIVGSSFLILSNDIVSLFLSIELQSYGLYLLSASHRNSESSIKGALTYFLLGSLSSCIILLGLSLLYFNTGSTNLEVIFTINSYYDNLINYEFAEQGVWSYILYIFMDYSQYTHIQLSLVILSVGLLFKISAAPFHFWSPDVYDSLPTSVTTFVAIIPKIAIFIILYNLVYFTDVKVYNTNLPWSYSLIISSVLSLIIGSLLGLTQHRFKRLYAYSTISHIGFMLLALSVNNMESYRAFFFYLIQYSISNLNAFMILLAIGNLLYWEYYNKNKKISIYSPIQLINQIKGFFYINPVLSISLIITLFSFVGIPPLIGFFGKQLILMSAIDKGFIYVAGIGIITSVISAVYYLLIIKRMCFEKSSYKSQIKDENTIHYINTPLSLVISILSLSLVCFILYDPIIFKYSYIIL